MIQLREIFTHIDCAGGVLVNPDGTRINRDDYLPRLILADEVILYAQFVNISEANGTLSVEKKSFNNNISLRIIGDADQDINTNVMFASSFLPEKSNLAEGLAAFHINSNTERFAEALKNSKSKKCEFVILAKFSDPICTAVLAKDCFIAENRPCETHEFTELLPDEIMSKEELQILLDLKSPLAHTHSAADITDLDFSGNNTFLPGDGITIENNVISADTDFLSVKNHSHKLSDISDWQAPENNNSPAISYTAGEGISIVNGVISCTISAGGSDGNFVSQEDFEKTVGDIAAVLDAINGEEV